MGVIYRHPSIDLADFNCSYLNKVLENISKEQKSVFVLVDLNVNLLNYNKNNETNEFLDSLASDSFIHLLLKLFRITSHSNTLKDKIFSVLVIHPDIISGNLTPTILVDLPQFSIIPNMFAGNKSNIWTGQNLIKKIFLDYFSVDWEDLLKTDELNADNQLECIYI